MNVRINETVLAGVGVEQERGESSGSGPSREERPADQGACLVADHGESCPGKVCSGQAFPWVICHCGVSRGRDGLTGVHQLIQTNWKPELWFYGTRWYRVSCTSGETASVFFSQQ